MHKEIPVLAQMQKMLEVFRMQASSFAVIVPSIECYEFLAAIADKPPRPPREPFLSLFSMDSKFQGL